MLQRLLILILLGSAGTLAAQTITLHNQLGHSGRVSALALSQDGKHLVTGSYDASARLWDVATGLELRRFDTPALVNAVAIAPDGQWILTGSLDGSAILWDITTGWGPAPLRGHAGEVTAVAFSPDGRFVLTGSKDQTALLWDRSSGQPLRRFQGHAGMVTSVSFSSDGQTVITSSADGTVRLWDTGTATERRQLHGPQGQVKAAALSPDGRWALEVVEGGGAWLLDAGTGQLIRSFSDASDPVEFAAFSQDGTLAVTAGGKTARVWNVRSGYQETWHNAPNGVGPSQFTPDGRSIVMATWDNSAVIWEIASGKVTQAFTGVGNRVQALSLSHNSRFVATGSEAGVADVWDLTSGAEVHHLDDQAGSVYAVGFSPDDQRVVMGSSDGSASVWNLDTGRRMQQSRGTSGALRAAAFTPDGKSVLTGSAGRIVGLWNLDTGADNQEFTLPLVPSLWPTIASISPDSKAVVTVIGGSEAHLWVPDSQEPPRTLAGHSDAIMAATFSFDGKQLLTGGLDKAVFLWDVATGAPMRKFNIPTPINLYSTVSALAFSPDGTCAIFGESKGEAQIVDVSSGNLIVPLKGHSDEIAAAAYSSDGRFIATASFDGTTRLWKAADGSPQVALISSPGGSWTAVDLDGSGRFDTNALDGGALLYWIASDQPLHPLPLDIFMRDYYEPRLAERLLSGSGSQFRPLPNPGSLNRVQPRVQIRSIRRGARPDEVWVDVWVAGNSDPTQTNGKNHTGAFDLRVFREGQLVDQFPRPRGGSSGHEDLGEWRQGARIAPPKGQEGVVHRSRVRLASADAGRPVVFSAYAFNEDRVKSATDQHPYITPKDIAPRTARAYVLTIGVNDYHSPGQHNLEFAVKDARVMSEALRKIVARQVVSITLVSDLPQGAVKSDQATKDNIRAVLGLLGETAQPEEARRQLLAAGVDSESVRSLQPATPDDAVIIAYSGHGYTQADGAFYLLPADSWAGEEITAGSLHKFISSEELSEWLRPVDAGELALIIDACHSAASVETLGFKPGPMGDRGLGQLAYDKGMRILAATQADDVAMEARSLREGVLTYALVEDGLTRDPTGHLPAAPDAGDRVSLADWLKYGERDTPRVYAKAANGAARMVRRDSTVDPAFAATVQAHAQTPALFDFQKTRETVVLNP